MDLICLDLEGVLIPEIWISLAKRTGIRELERTTRDEPDYSKLMNGRLEILREHGLGISDIQDVIAGVEPMDGAREFLAELRRKKQVVILSDTFKPFAAPIMAKLEWPTLLCNDLVIGGDGTIEDFILRQSDGKLMAVRGFQSMNLKVLAAGDSYNDLSMIKAADRGAFFRPPETIVREEPEIPVFREYGAFLEFILRPSI
jgi:phosphoserine/homoserine phosphotransferase